MAEKITLDVSNLLSFKQAKAFLGVSRPTIYALIERQELHPINIGANRYLLRDELERVKKAKRDGQG